MGCHPNWMETLMAATAIETPTREKLPLLQHFSPLADPRQSGKVLYPLDEIVLLLVCATISACDDLVEVAEWGRERLDFLSGYLPYAGGIPSHDTLCDVLAAIDARVFRDCFTAWVADMREVDPDVVAIDGKTSRRTHDRRRGAKPLHLVSAWASRQRLVLGQQATEEKSNEITAIPLLLDRLVLKGAIVTIDAMGTQTEIAEKIIEKEADYCLALKENRPALHGEVETYFADPQSTGIERATTVDGEHGRIETRGYAVCSDIEWLHSDRRHPGELKFPGLAAIGMVESEVERNGVVSFERRYFLLSTVLTAMAFAAVVRGHWGVENRLHWVLDVIFDEDQSRLRTGHAAENMAVVRHMALNLMRTTRTKASLKVRRKKAAWSTAYLADVLAGHG